MSTAVGIVTGSFPSPSETFVVNLVTGLLDSGLDVRVYALSEGPRETGGPHPAMATHNLAARTRAAPGLSRRGWRRLASIPPLVAANWAHRATLARVYGAMRRGRLPMSARTIQAAALFLDADVPPLLHCQFGQYGRLLSGLRSAGVVDARIITHFRGGDISRELRKRGASVYDELFRDGDYFLTNCEFFRRRLVEIGCPQDRLAVSRSGIDLGFFGARPPRPVGRDPCRLLTVGRLVEKKGTEFAVRAAAALKRDGVDVRLDVIGQGALRGALERLIGELDARNFVSLHGVRPPTEIRDFLTAADVFLAPSVTARDGDQDATVNTVKEAMAVGVPVVASDHGGIPELVEDGLTGRLVPERDADALAEAVRWLVEHPEAAGTLVRAARARVEADYDNARIVERLTALYRRVHDGQEPRPGPPTGARIPA